MVSENLKLKQYIQFKWKKKLIDETENQSKQKGKKAFKILMMTRNKKEMESFHMCKLFLWISELFVFCF